jgi:glucuronoarabinoxylan endo-1,4-beta-xylanase
MTTTSGGGGQGTGGMTNVSTGSGGKLGAGGATGAGSGGRVGTGGLGTGGSTGLAGGRTGTGGATGPGGAVGGATGAGGSTTDGGGATGAGGGNGVTVALDKIHQTIQGFGINDTWALEALPSSLFSTTGDGIGLSILRIGMSDEGSDYDSTIAADVTMAKSAGAKIIGSCWSPPASCKTNNTVNSGGHLKPECYESWATTIAAFAKGHGLYAMSAQSEPDYQSCFLEPCSGSGYPTTLFSAEEMVAFVKVVGPKLRALSPPVQVIAPEPSEWLHLWTNDTAPGGPDALSGKYDYGHALAKDADAWAQVDILGTHQYDTQTAEPWPSDVPQTKPVWMTEMAGVRKWPEGGPSSDISNGVAVAGWIHSALVTGDASAWLWWWYKAYGTDDNEGLLLKSGGSPTKRYYTLGNYSKFVRPGYARVDVTGGISTDVLLSAYQGTDGTAVIVAINKGSTTVTLPIAISGGPAPASLTPWVTSASDNLKSGTPLSPNGGLFTATLASLTVTTLVGK